MLRWLEDVADKCEVWGTDISGEHILWCKQNMSPPFHFFITTTNPHLPFPDNYFDVIYAGSVFTHIDDLADTWMLELRRIMKPGGRAYITIHDNHTIRVLSEQNRTLTSRKRCSAVPTSLRRLITGCLLSDGSCDRKYFVDTDFFTNSLKPFWQVLSAMPSYGFKRLSCCRSNNGQERSRHGAFGIGRAAWIGDDCELRDAYRVNLHKVVAAGIPELKLHTLITHADAEFSWEVDIPPSIHLSYFGKPGDSPLSGTFSIWWRAGRLEGGQLIRYIQEHNIRAVITVGHRYISYLLERFATPIVPAFRSLFGVTATSATIGTFHP